MNQNDTELLATLGCNVLRARIQNRRRHTVDRKLAKLVRQRFFAFPDSDAYNREAHREVHEIMAIEEQPVTEADLLAELSKQSR